QWSQARKKAQEATEKKDALQAATTPDKLPTPNRSTESPVVSAAALNSPTFPALLTTPTTPTAPTALTNTTAIALSEPATLKPWQPKPKDMPNCRLNVNNNPASMEYIPSDRLVDTGTVNDPNSNIFFKRVVDNETGYAMDSSFQALIPLDEPDGADNNKELAGNFSFMTLDLDHDDKLKDPANLHIDLLLPTATQLVKASAVMEALSTLTSNPHCSVLSTAWEDTSLHHQSSTMPMHLAAPLKTVPLSPISSHHLSTTISAPQQHSTTHIFTGVSSVVLAELSALPAPILATLSIALQAEVALFKACSTAPTCTSNSGPGPTLILSHDLAEPPAKVTIAEVMPWPVTIDELFDDNAYLSNKPSALEINPSVKPNRSFPTSLLDKESPIAKVTDNGMEGGIKTRTKRSQPSPKEFASAPNTVNKGTKGALGRNSAGVEKSRPGRNAVTTAGKQSDNSFPKRATRSTTAGKNRASRK
ncbi:hypothetical protein RHS03_06328, partial [Rhizoctonia solani]